MSSNAELEDFAGRLMALVRDPAIESCDALADGLIHGPRGALWHEAIADPETRRVVRELLPDIVDEVLFQLLHALDTGELPLAWIGAGTVLPLEELGRGEMAGLVAMGRDGWIDRFSAHRFLDHLPDLP